MNWSNRPDTQAKITAESLRDAYNELAAWAENPPPVKIRIEYEPVPPKAVATATKAMK